MGREDSIGDTTPTKSVEKLLADNASMRKSIQELSRKTEEYEEELKGLRNSSRRNRPGKDEDDDESEAEVEERLKQIVSSTVTDTINGWWNKQQKESEEENQRVQAFLSERNKFLKKAHIEFPESTKEDSALSKRAMEIFRDPENKMSNDRGLPLRPDAEYDAYARASNELRSKQSEQEGAKAGATFASAGSTGGAGAQASGKTELSDEEFLALTPAERFKYQQEKAGLT